MFQRVAAFFELNYPRPSRLLWPIFLFAGILQSQDPALSPTTPDFSVQRQKADELYAAGKILESLPLYTELEKRQPNESIFAERKAAGLIAKSSTRAKGPQQMAVLHQAYRELLRARALGDNSAYALTMIEKLGQLFADSEGSPTAVTAVSPAVLLKQGHDAQAKGDYHAALDCYAEASRLDPNSYEAAVAAGEAAAQMRDAAVAGNWFTKAIGINPSLETAYQDWGKALMSLNQASQARDHFIDGVIAWPYSHTSWDGLQQWAEGTHARLSSPYLKVPPTSDTIDPLASVEDGTGRSAWLQYLVARLSFRNSVFRQKFPTETQYRHTLLEEVSCLQRAAQAARQQNLPADKLEPSLNTLLVLTDNHMLEPWILLHGADSGITRDYAAYRDAHRDQLRTYIITYDIQNTP